MQEDVALCQIYTFCVALGVNNDTQHYSSCKCLRKAFLFQAAQPFTVTSLYHKQKGSFSSKNPNCLLIGK